MKKFLLKLQSESDSLRLRLKHKIKFNSFDEEFDNWMNELRGLDNEFSSKCKEFNFSLNRFGRLI